jgi:hypothetical protein
VTFSFKVVPSLPSTEPTVAYFTGLAQKTRAILGTEQDTLSSVWSLCEYLDCVDAGDLLMDKTTYRTCVQRLAAFLATHSNRRNVESLARKSWAAKTLLDMVDASGIVVELTARRQFAA